RYKKKRIRMGPELLRGRCERGKEHIPSEDASMTGRSAKVEGPQSLREKFRSWTEEGKAKREQHKPSEPLPRHHSLR
ncbi:hypothetical protein PS059_24890, partial [Shigella sonnei]|nr:hypothetical protein [Shigella sonnei]